MRSSAELLRLGVLAAACAAGAPRAQDEAAPPPVAASAASASAPGGDQRAARIEKAVDELRADPLLSGKHMEKRLRWIDDEQEKKKKTPPVDPSLFGWLAALGRFLSDISRFLLWGGMAVLVALVLVSARHLVNLRAFERRAKPDAAVSHVRDLDVRPESLPDDVGAAAWALWQAGRVQDALSMAMGEALCKGFGERLDGRATAGGPA
jgi:hypothetical protein